MTAPDGESVVDRVVNRETSLRSKKREKGAICFEYEKGGEKTRVRIARDVDPSSTAAITTSEPDAREYADPLPQLPLAGSGETLPDCGEEFAGLFCTGCGAPHEVGRTCRRSRCPRCWNSWAFHHATSIASKVEALGRHEYSQNGKKVKPHHLTVSLRDSTRFNSKDPLKQGIEAIKPLLSKVDVDTGYLIYHPYRIAPEYRGDVLGHESGDGDMTWKDVLGKVESEEWSWTAVREEFLVYAPHFHVICLSEFVDTTGVDKIEDQTGVVIHRIATEREDGVTKSIADTEELCRATAYSLSHAGLAPENEGQRYRAAVRPFGKVANFEAWDAVEADVTEAMRSVAGKVLGIEFPDPTCSEHVHDHGHDHGECDHNHATHSSPARSPLTADGGSSSDTLPAETWDAANDGFYNDDTSSWDATAGMVPSSVDTPTNGQTSKCGGQLAPMWAVDSYLGSLEWLSEIEERHGEERVIELRQARDDWHDMGSPRPEVVPDE